MHLLALFKYVSVFVANTDNQAIEKNFPNSIDWSISATCLEILAHFDDCEQFLRALKRNVCIMFFFSSDNHSMISLQKNEFTRNLILDFYFIFFEDWCLHSGSFITDLPKRSVWIDSSFSPKEKVMIHRTELKLDSFGTFPFGESNDKSFE